MPGTGALILLAFASLVVIVLLVLLQLTRLGFHCAVDDSGPAAAADVHCLGFVSVYLCGRATACESGRFTIMDRLTG